jgi:hypothetical protein
MYDDILGSKNIIEKGIESVDNNTKEAEEPKGTIGYGNSTGVFAEEDEDDVWDVNNNCEDEQEDCNCDDEQCNCEDEQEDCGC